MQLSEQAQSNLLRLLAELERTGYEFVAPTPATHARIIRRPDKKRAASLRDVFGWSLPFPRALLPSPIGTLLDAGGLVEQDGDLLRSRIRVARLHGRLFAHSAYPTEDEDSVFLGPDSYRFVDFLRAELPGIGGVGRLVDLGAGAGVGAILAAPLLPGARLTLVDVNRSALRFAWVNAAQAGVEVELVEGAGLDAVSGPVDLVIANPPYIMDQKDRTYRDGGGMRGAQISRDWALAAARRLEPGGRMLLYTGVAIVEGCDALKDALENDLPAFGCTLRYRELDPDIFGEELEKPPYADVERIAAVGAVISKA